MSARVDAEGRLDAGLAERAMKRDVALLEAREVVLADSEIKGRPVRIGDVGRQAEKHVPAVEPARVEGSPKAARNMCVGRRAPAASFSGIGRNRLPEKLKAAA